MFSSAFLLFVLELALVNQAFAAMQMTVPQVTESDDLDYLGKVPGILRWTPVPGTSYYEVDISRTDDFVKFRHFKLDHKNRFHIRVYPSIQYYWKVKAFSEGDQILAESETFPYKVIYTGEEPKESEPMVLTAEIEASDPTPIDEAEIGESQELDEPLTAQIQVDEFFKKH